MGEKLTITLSEKHMVYLRKYADSLGQRTGTVGGELMSLLLDDMEADDRKQVVKVPLKGGVR